MDKTIHKCNANSNSATTMTATVQDIKPESLPTAFMMSSSNNGNGNGNDNGNNEQVQEQQQQGQQSQQQQQPVVVYPYSVKIEQAANGSAKVSIHSYNDDIYIQDRTTYIV